MQILLSLKNLFDNYFISSTHKRFSQLSLNLFLVKVETKNRVNSLDKIIELSSTMLAHRTSLHIQR